MEEGHAVIKVLIVDDHGHVRKGLGEVFAQTHDISVAASVCQARKVGVSGYVGKDDDPGDLATSVRTVAAGNSVWSPAAAAHLPRCNSSPASDPPSHRCRVRHRAGSRPLRPHGRRRRSPMGLPEVAVPNRSSL
jgi:DNA-binding NarL/FixJ family response regulator